MELSFLDQGKEKKQLCNRETNDRASTSLISQIEEVTDSADVNEIETEDETVHTENDNANEERGSFS